MTPFDTRKAKEAASRQKLQEVAKAGEALGLWTIHKTQTEEGGDAWTFVTVETEPGRRFFLRGGSWGREGAIGAQLTSTDGEHGLTIKPSDVHSGGAPDANASHERPAETIAKDLHKRAMISPEAIALSDKMLARLADMERDWKSLRANVARLERLGYVFNNIRANETYEAAGFNDSARSRGMPYTVKVNAQGACRFDGECHIDKLAAVLAAFSTK